MTKPSGGLTQHNKDCSDGDLLGLDSSCQWHQCSRARDGHVTGSGHGNCACAVQLKWLLSDLSVHNEPQLIPSAGPVLFGRAPNRVEQLRNRTVLDQPIALLAEHQLDPLAHQVRFEPVRDRDARHRGPGLQAASDDVPLELGRVPAPTGRIDLRDAGLLSILFSLQNWCPPANWWAPSSVPTPVSSRWG